MASATEMDIIDQFLEKFQEVDLGSLKAREELERLLSASQRCARRWTYWNN